MSFTPSESKREITHRLTSSLVVLGHLQLFLDACQSKPRSSCHLLLRNPLPCQTRPLVTGLLERTRLSEFHALRFLPGKRRHEVRGRLSGTVPVEGSALDCDSPAARCGKDSRRSSAEGTPHGDDRQPMEEGLEVWTGVDFSECVVALPGEAVRPWEQAYRCLERCDNPDTAGMSLISRGWSVEADG